MSAGSQAQSISGTVDAELRFRFKVDYKTTVNSAQCQYNDYITGMRIPLTESVSVVPLFSNNNYKVAFPFESPQLKKECGWVPSVVFVCMGKALDAVMPYCQGLFFMDGASPETAQSMDLFCDMETLRCQGESGLQRFVVSGLSQLRHLNIHKNKD